MQTGLYVALSSQIALERRMNTIADNVANANTVGFRGTEIKFDEVLGNTQPAKVSFVDQGKDYLKTSSGALTLTGGQLDVAIKGNAWFSIDTQAGPALTRDGRFTITEAGELVTVNGHPVLDAGGAPIQLNAGGGEIVIGADGAISQGGNPVAALGLFEGNFENGFTRYGNSAVMPMTPPEAVIDRFDVGVMQGYVEEANVDPIQSMTQLIAVSRAFDHVSALMRQGEGTLDEAIKTLGGSR
ncbi:flagellar basal-body rod protein FlgF [Ensifer soli]|uniref:flagellar basal-body rod protein FlgF n=1 Tax=Ciceribacter sp. sgz301302 TaxID=3342379 RepID=UPI0035BB9755